MVVMAIEKSPLNEKVELFHVPCQFPSVGSIETGGLGLDDGLGLAEELELGARVAGWEMAQPVRITVANPATAIHEIPR